MKAERLLDALGQIDDCFLAELYESEAAPVPRGRRLRILALMAAVLVALTACAASVAQIWEDGWFDAFFSDGGTAEAVEELGINQAELLDQGLVHIGQSLALDGYTVTLESALSDGYRAFVKFAVEAPVDVKLDSGKYYLDLHYQIHHADGEKVKLPVRVVAVTFLEDQNKEDNRVALLMETLLQTSADSTRILEKGMVWTIYLDAFGIDHGRGNREELLDLEGQSFAVTFDEELLLRQEQEVLEKPIRCGGTWQCWRYKFPVRVKVTSFRIRALSATLTYQEPWMGYGEGILLDKTYVVLKDGTKIEAHFSMGGNHGREWEDSLEFPVPIAVEDVAYVEFPGGQKIRINE